MFRLESVERREQPLHGQLLSYAKLNHCQAECSASELSRPRPRQASSVQPQSSRCYSLDEVFSAPDLIVRLPPWTECARNCRSRASIVLLSGRKLPGRCP